MAEDATAFVSRTGTRNPSDPERSPPRRNTLLRKSPHRRRTASPQRDGSGRSKPRRVSGWGTTVRGLGRLAALLWQNS